MVDGKAVSRREAMKSALKAGAYAAPVILSMAAAGGVAAQVTPPPPGLTGLFLTNVVNIPNPARGQTVNYAINIVNRGPLVATGIVVSFVFPPGQFFSGSGFDIGNYNGTTWTIPSLGVGAGAA